MPDASFQFGFLKLLFGEHRIPALTDLERAPKGTNLDELDKPCKRVRSNPGIRVPKAIAQKRNWNWTTGNRFQNYGRLWTKLDEPLEITFPIHNALPHRGP